MIVQSVSVVLICSLHPACTHSQDYTPAWLSSLHWWLCFNHQVSILSIICFHLTKHESWLGATLFDYFTVFLGGHQSKLFKSSWLHFLAAESAVALSSLLPASGSGHCLLSIIYCPAAGDKWRNQRIQGFNYTMNFDGSINQEVIPRSYLISAVDVGHGPSNPVQSTYAAYLGVFVVF